MASETRDVQFRRHLKRLEAGKQAAAKGKVGPRERARLRLRCKVCGRLRAAYGKFGVCRPCSRSRTGGAPIRETGGACREAAEARPQPSKGRPSPRDRPPRPRQGTPL